MRKCFELFYKSTTFKIKNLYFLLLIFFICKINSADEVPYLKAIYLGNNHYYLVYPTQLNYFEPDVTNVLVTKFTTSNQKIQSVDEIKFINFGDFKDNNNNNILIVKNYLYNFKSIYKSF